MKAYEYAFVDGFLNEDQFVQINNLGARGYRLLQVIKKYSSDYQFTAIMEREYEIDEDLETVRAEDAIRTGE